jgi:hypothetical protein
VSKKKSSENIQFGATSDQLAHAQSLLKQEQH